MIFTERKITIRKGKSSIDEPVILYRGDFEVELRFTIMETKYRFKSGVNLVDSEKASHAQLALLAPDGTNVFTEIGRCEDGTAIFVLSKEMIDELSEVGLYSFQIRLFDYYRESRVSIPPVEFGIEVREPIAAEDHVNTVDDAMVGYSIAKTSVLDKPVGPTFNDDGQYNKTDWETGDRISEGRLNKIEDALNQINQNEKNDVSNIDRKVNSNYNVLDAKINEVATKGTTSEVIKQSVEDEIDALIETGELDAMTIPDYSIELIHMNPDILDNACASVILNWDDVIMYGGGMSASFMIEKQLQEGDIVEFSVLLKSDDEIPIRLGVYRSNKHNSIGTGSNSKVYNIPTDDYMECSHSMEINSTTANYSYIYCHIMSDVNVSNTTVYGLKLIVSINGAPINANEYVFVNHYLHSTAIPVVTCNVDFKPVNDAIIATLNSIELTGKKLFLGKKDVLTYDNFPEVFKFMNEPSINLFNKNDKDIVLGKYFYKGAWVNGSSSTVGGVEYSTSGFIPVEFGNVYAQKADATCSYWDENKNYLYDGPMNPLINIPTDLSIKYIRISFVTSEIDTTMFVKGEEYPTEYVAFSQNALILDSTNCIIDESLMPKVDLTFTQWKGKKWYACGTSMTSLSWGRYTKYLAALSGLQETNLGVPNGTIANTQYPSIQQALLNIGDDADLITMEAGVNDWAYNVPLGQLGDKEPTTYYGALYTAFELFTSKPKARIVTITMHHGTQRSDPWIKNTEGVTQQDYNNALIEMSNFYSIPCIRLAEESGIGPNRYNLYLRDNIHHTELGGEVFAKFVWSKLKYIDPLQTEQ